MRALVADDDVTSRLIVGRLLGLWGYRVVEATNGLDAWQALTSDHPPRVAILDWDMPGIDGVEICRRLLERRDPALVYTILLTGRSTSQDLVVALDGGAHCFLCKPVDPPVLRSLVAVGRRLVEAEDTLARYAAEMERLAEKRATQLINAEELARTDPLTGARNRRGFVDACQQELARAQRYNRPLSVLAMDIDHFKAVNDTWGHAAGDDALRAVTWACRDRLREGDLIARIGGDELCVLLPETPAAAAFAVAERIRRIVEGLTVPAPSGAIQLTVSIGAASFAAADSSVEALLGRADAALYRAKAEGRNRVVTDAPASATACSL